MFYSTLDIAHKCCGIAASMIVIGGALLEYNSPGTLRRVVTPYVFSYYEVDDKNNLTNSGRLFPADGSKNTQYDGIRTGTIFKAEDEVNLRAGPSGSADVVEILEKSECVKVNALAVKVKMERNKGGSGGWLRVTRVDCPI